jgi:hypothetical protein
MSIDAQTTAIKAALDKPGKTVAAVQLRVLLAQGGVLQRLAADGYDIVSPVGLDEDD